MTIIDILEPLSLTEAIVKCGFCRGTGDLSFGKSYESDPKECPICNGKGKLLIKAECFPLVECARCRGTGSTYLLTTINEDSIHRLIEHVCSSCQGAGCQALTGTWQIVRSGGTATDDAERIYLTGLTVNELEVMVENNQDFTCCFVCKRQNGQESVGLKRTNGAVISNLKILNYEKSCGGVVYIWPICTECAWLLGLVS